MRLRVAGLWRHPRSKMFWFRMGVPEKYRARVGKREWKESLGTSDETEARRLHALKLVEVHNQMRAFDAVGAIAIDDQADKIVADGFDALARANIKAHEIAADYDMARGLDHVCFTMLQMMGFRARLDWGGSYARKAQEEALGEADEDIWPMEQPGATGAFPSFAHRDAVSINIELFEANPLFKGAAFREVARAHLAAQDWKAAEFEAQIVAQAAGIVLRPKGPLFNAVAERILRRLAEHRFGHWPTGIQNVLQPMMTAMATHLQPEQQAPVTAAFVGTPLSVVFKAWRADTKATLKTQDEFEASIDRFISVFGDMAVEKIGAKLFYQLASQRLAQLCSRTARLIEIRNPLCGATLAADAQQAGDAVTQLLANAAHRQVSYLAFAAAIPEWCDFRIYQLSSTLAADCLVAEEPPKAPSPHFGADGSAASLRPIT